MIAYTRSYRFTILLFVNRVVVKADVLFVTVASMGAFTVGRDHITVDNGIDCIRRNKANSGKDIHDWNDNRDNDLGQEQEHKKRMQAEQQQNTKRAHQIALDTQRREDQRILEHFAYLHIEGDQHHVNIRTHDEIEKRQRREDPEQHVHPEGTNGTRIINDVKDQNNGKQGVKKTKQKALLEIALDTVEKVTEYEDGVTADKSS